MREERQRPTKDVVQRYLRPGQVDCLIDEGVARPRLPLLFGDPIHLPVEGRDGQGESFSHRPSHTMLAKMADTPEGHREGLLAYYDSRWRGPITRSGR